MPDTVPPEKEEPPWTSIEHQATRSVVGPPIELEQPKKKLKATAEPEETGDSMTMGQEWSVVRSPDMRQLATRNLSSQGYQIEDTRKLTATAEGELTETGEPEIDEKYVIKRIVALGWDDEDNSPLFRVRWYGYPSDSNTWEPTAHLSLSLVLAYCRRAKLDEENINATLVSLIVLGRTSS
ncbi:hypothetical protein BWQ96_05905 [Gracilariopsis chorda]|uniref:Chromo domain-containing protein n=1 Tax=Gracilariopsis chorda TaxID=448386 RepID=A0A2V3IQG0_9FLOR|nr:hypothetical protein BWQ96_05905 [Gracilariopsis chorda]|eukprot:PXF44341.1 hypothetical protein BWQ96_05905 [Gracilariopsis chorda]